MSSEVMDWDGVYREQGEFQGPPPWNIGEPQPELAALIEAGKFRSDVLDAGCGFAELSLVLAAHGYTVLGVDLTPRAVAAATKAASERGLATASFVQADITKFDGCTLTCDDIAPANGQSQGGPLAAKLPAAGRTQPLAAALGTFGTIVHYTRPA